MTEKYIRITGTLSDVNLTRVEAYKARLKREGRKDAAVRMLSARVKRMLLWAQGNGRDVSTADNMLKAIDAYLRSSECSKLKKQTKSAYRTTLYQFAGQNS